MKNPRSLLRSAAFEAARTWAGARLADPSIDVATAEVAADHPCRTAPLTSRYMDSAITGFVGAAEGRTEGRDWFVFVTPFDDYAVVFVEGAEDPYAFSYWRFTRAPAAAPTARVASDLADPGDGEDDSPDSVEPGPEPISIMTFRDLEIHIDGHIGDVIKGVDYEGKPYEIRRSCPYGFLPGTEGDDGEGYDCYVLPDQSSDRVYILTQLKARSLRFDEQKAVLGASSPEQAEQTVREHIHERMFGRMGSLSYADFKRQVEAHRKALAEGTTGPLRIVTDEDRAEAKSMQSLADHLGL